ncbi:hypothetical protein M501DRAFT_997096 [Patellaria atrata CBS 101060]|uniref:DUF3844 domain-containing protein n=1 Tax=Patellaria atrata CBS 101060 TaxID=1346257 RepID=A0A9P4VP33_9PEZI|nr:hypothetical protein M501DRAFT_997096 [Patellaria atrata CBS 101060]
MKLSSSFVLSSLLSHSWFVAASSSSKAIVYLPDQVTSSRRPEGEELSAETARLVFAQRLGLSRYHSLKGQDGRVIQQISDFSARPQQLFGEGSFNPEEPKVIVIVEDVENAEDILPSGSQIASFTIPNPPSPSENDALLRDFSAQAENIPRNEDMAFITSIDTTVWDAFDKAQELRKDTTLLYKSHVTCVHVKSLMTASRQDSETYRTTVLSLREALSTLVNHAVDSSTSLTIALMPPHSPSFLSKRASHPWGTYTHPTRSSQRQKPEALLSSPVDSDVPASAESSGPARPPVNGSLPLRGILPSCFSTKRACEKATLNCTGHGHCYEKYNSKGDDDKVCFTCACTIPEVRTNKDGTKKTTTFGGPACQKKNVVMPFWLLAGFTVFLVFMISWGVGLLYNMGNEELPSVIGAGVSGPRAK